MLKNYFKTFFRYSWIYRKNAIFNVISLVLGITSFIIIYLFINNELIYDTCFTNAENIYRVESYDKKENKYYRDVPKRLAGLYKESYPDVIQSITCLDKRENGFNLSYKEIFYKEKFCFYADSTFFDVFQLEFVEGNANNALVGMNSCVISESTAKKLFGNENPMGKPIKINQHHDVFVKGIFKDVPEQAHIDFKALISYPTLEKIWGNSRLGSWCTTYLRLYPDKSAEALQANQSNFLKTHFSKEYENGGINFINIRDIHLKSKAVRVFKPKGNLIVIKLMFIFLNQS